MKDKYFYLSHDLVFKYIFGTNANKRFTKRFLELYLDKNIGNIKILNSVKLMPNNIKTRKLEMDVLVYIPKPFENQDISAKDPAVFFFFLKVPVVCAIWRCFVVYRSK